MPITYQPPAPVGVFAGLARQQSQGVPISEMYAAEMQAKQAAAAQQAGLMAQDRQFSDHMALQQAQLGASQAFSPRDQGMVEGQMALQQQRVNLQMQANQEELTQGENLRLQRLKQGEESIKQQVADGTITKAEGAQMLGQLRTPIQVFEARKAASQIRHQDMQNQLLQQQIETQRSIEIRKNKDDEARLQFSAATAEGKLKQIVDPGMARALTEKYTRMMPDMAPADIKKAVEDELMAGGHYSTWYPNEKGVLQQAKEDVHGAKAASSGGEGATTSRGNKGGIPEFDPSKAYHDAESAVDKLVTAGALKPEDAQAEIMKRVNARKDFHASYVGEKQAASQAGKPVPFNPADPSTGTEQQKGRIVALQDVFQQIHDAAANGRLAPHEQAVMARAAREAMNLTAQHLDRDGNLVAPPVVKKRLEQLNKVLAPLSGGAAAKPSSLPAGPLSQEQKMALAQRLQDQSQGPQQAPPEKGPDLPGFTWIPPHEAIEPGTGKRVLIPGRHVPNGAAVPHIGERDHERGFRYFMQGLDRLKKSATGEGPSISLKDY